jgi:flagellar basal-body rod protein FlgB
MSWIDSSLSGQVIALQLKSERAELIAGNIANSDTPNYKARDIDFRAEFERRISGESGGALRTTNAQHMKPEGGGSAHITFSEEGGGEDGNTVESEKEQATYTKNAIQYQVSLQFLNSKIRGLKLALKGE